MWYNLEGPPTERDYKFVNDSPLEIVLKLVNAPPEQLEKDYND